MILILVSPLEVTVRGETLPKRNPMKTWHCKLCGIISGNAKHTDFCGVQCAYLAWTVPGKGEGCRVQDIIVKWEGKTYYRGSKSLRRFIWKLLVSDEPIDKGIVINTTCGDVKCVAPDHLEKITRARWTSMKVDMMKKAKEAKALKEHADKNPEESQQQLIIHDAPNITVEMKPEVYEFIQAHFDTTQLPNHTLLFTFKEKSDD